TYVCAHHHRLAPHTADLRGDGLGALRVRIEIDSDVGAPASQFQGDPFSDPLARAGHESGLVRKEHGRIVSAPRHGVLPHVLPSRIFRRADVMELLGVLETILAAELTIVP